MEELKLYMLLLGCKPQGRRTEQHDVFFGIAPDLKSLVPAMKKFWPEAKGRIHVDAWREVSRVDGFKIEVKPRSEDELALPTPSLFFLNLGGYRENEFDEFHYRMVLVGDDLEEVKKRSKQTAFFKHSNVSSSATTRNAQSHIDDKYGIDVDDAYRVDDILSSQDKLAYRIDITAATDEVKDDLYLGYYRIEDILLL